MRRRADRAAGTTAAAARGGQHEPGRPLVSGVPVEFLQIVEPGALYGDRLTSIDLRFGKILRYGNTRTTINLDVYNLFNSNTTEVFQRTVTKTRQMLKKTSYTRRFHDTRP